MTQTSEITLGALEGNGTHGYNSVVYNQVVRENYRNMIQYCVGHFSTLTLSDAEDLVQQVFTELYMVTTEGIRNRNVPVRRWLFQYLHRRALNLIRSQRHGEQDRTQMDTEAVDIIALIPQPDSTDDQEIIDFLTDCIENQLSNRTQEVMQLMYVEGLKQVEVAQRLGITAARVNQLHKKGLSRLKGCLTEAGFLDESQ